jgi:hypothetical protein
MKPEQDSKSAGTMSHILSLYVPGIVIRLCLAATILGSGILPWLVD